MPNLEIKVKPNQALSESLKVREESLKVVREQMQAGFTQLGKELAELRQSNAARISEPDDDVITRTEVSHYKTRENGIDKDTTAVYTHMSCPPVTVVLEKGAKLSFSNNVNVDVGTHVNVHNRQDTNKESHTTGTIAMGDNVIKSIGDILSGLFKS